MRHNWINFPTSSIRKCTCCGMMRRINDKGARYSLKGEEYTKAPPCKPPDDYEYFT